MFIICLYTVCGPPIFIFFLFSNGTSLFSLTYIYIESCIGFVGTNSPLRFANGRGRWLDYGQGHDAPFPAHAGIFISTIDVHRVFGIIESTQ